MSLRRFCCSVCSVGKLGFRSAAGGVPSRHQLNCVGPLSDLLTYSTSITEPLQWSLYLQCSVPGAGISEPVCNIGNIRQH